METTKPKQKWTISPLTGAKTANFSTRKQPSPEAKRAGWAKKKKLWYWIEKYQRLSLEKFNILQGDILKYPKKYNMYQLQAVAYIKKLIKGDTRVMFDNLDRSEGKAIQKTVIEMTDQDKIQEVIDKTKDFLD